MDNEYRNWISPLSWSLVADVRGVATSPRPLAGIVEVEERSRWSAGRPSGLSGVLRWPPARRVATSFFGSRRPRPEGSVLVFLAVVDCQKNLYRPFGPGATTAKKHLCRAAGRRRRRRRWSVQAECDPYPRRKDLGQ